ncbi:MAG: sulfur carrier protein ThiS [Alphaproteobacteria bacterium]
MNLIINGEQLNSTKQTLADILMEQGISIDTKGVAVALNEQVITKSKWNETNLNDNDVIEIVKPFQGG